VWNKDPVFGVIVGQTGPYVLRFIVPPVGSKAIYQALGVARKVVQKLKAETTRGFGAQQPGPEGMKM
jgi:hypothetical protein